MTDSEARAGISDKLGPLCSEAGLTALLNGIGEGFYAVDRDWRIILFNNEAGRHFGVAPEEIIGRNLWETFPRARETGLGQLFLKTMQSREVVRSETESVLFGGRWLAYRLFPLGDGIGVVFRDITDHRAAEAERDILVKELEHRIKNTLAMVQSIADQTFRPPRNRRCCRWPASPARPGPFRHRRSDPPAGAEDGDRAVNGGP